MTKLLTVIAATLLTVTAFASAADAGCGGGGGFSRSYHRPARAVQSVRRSKPRVEVAAPTLSKATELAETDETAAPINEIETAARSENSSITVDETTEEKPAKKVAAKPAKNAEQEVASAGTLGCRTFLPSVGMTVSVACDKN